MMHARPDPSFYNTEVDQWQDEEYPYKKGKVYLDHGGATLPAKSLIDATHSFFLTNLLGNPHSASEPARRSGRIVDDVRHATLEFFGADPEHFDLVFVANATAAIKMVMEAVRDLALDQERDGLQGGFRYMYHKDSHTSMVGVREATGIKHVFNSDAEVEEWIEGNMPPRSPKDWLNAPGYDEHIGLFCYPGQSNFNGRRLPLSWPGRIRASNLSKHRNIYTLLDAAALASTSSLAHVFTDPNTAPDFTAVSFYKIFGKPDIGGLIVRKSTGHILTMRKYFGGGTIFMAAVVGGTWHKLNDRSIHEGLEDGTLPFHEIAELGLAMEVHKRLFKSMEHISRHVTYLAKRMYDGMRALRHGNGLPLCVIYEDVAVPSTEYCDRQKQGGTIAFNLVHSDGSYWPYIKVEETATAHGIFLRSGGLCNSGGLATAVHLSPWEMQRNWSAGHRCGYVRGFEIIHRKPTGVVRASLGAMTTITDVDTFITFLADTFLDFNAQAPLPAATAPIHVVADQKTLLLHSDHNKVDQNGWNITPKTSVESFGNTSSTRSTACDTSNLKKLTVSQLRHEFVSDRPSSDILIQQMDAPKGPDDEHLTPPVTPPGTFRILDEKAPKHRASRSPSNWRDAAHGREVVYGSGDEVNRMRMYKSSLNVEMPPDEGALSKPDQELFAPKEALSIPSEGTPFGSSPKRQPWYKKLVVKSHGRPKSVEISRNSMH